MIFSKKVFGVSFHNLRCGYCGADHFVPKLLLVLWLVLRGEVYYRCHDCKNYSRYTLQYHVVHDTLDADERLYNRMQDDRRLKP